MRNKEGKGTNPAVWILAVSFVFSLITLIAYLSELDYSDETLFFLLSVLRYSSFFVCVSSIYLLIACIIQIIRSPSIRSAAGIFLFILSALYGAGMIILDAFITSISGGNT